jgi:hypothetical protein
MFRGQRSWLLALGLSFVAAIVAALLLGRLPIEISVDFESPAGEVTARWPDGEHQLEELAAEFSPHHYKVRVTAPGSEAKGIVGGYQMIAMAGIDQVTYSDESLWATASNYFMLHGPTRPATLELEGWTIGPNPYLSFETDFLSESVEVQSAEAAPLRLILRSEERGKQRYAIQSDARRYRYTGVVPRNALDDLTVVVSAEAPPALHRLYVNGFVPRMYFVDALPAKRAVGVAEGNWTPQWEGRSFPVPGAFTLGTHFGVTALVLWPGLLIAIVVLYFFARWTIRAFRALWQEPRITGMDGAIPGKVLAAFWFPAVVVWCLFLLVYYPGTMNADSLTQWSEIRTFEFTAIHPPIYALVMWLGTCLWDSPATTAFFQILAASVVVAWAFALLWRAGVHRAVVLTLYVITVLSPRNSTTLISLVKDTPYAIALMGLVVCLASFLLQPQRRLALRWAIAGLCLGIAAVFRHNGPLLALTLLPLLVLYFPRQWRAGLVLLAAFLAIFLGVKHVVYPNITIERSEGGLHDLTTCHLAILLDRDVPLRSEEYAFLSQVRDLEDGWAYSPRRVASTAQPFLDCYHRAWAKENGGPYFQHYQNIVSRNMLNASIYFLERGEFLYVPWQRNDDMETYFLGISRNDLGLWNSEFFLDLHNQLRALLAETVKPTLSWLFWRPALPLYLVILACIVLCVRQRSIAWSIVYLPFFINTATLALAAVSQAARYQFPLTFAAAFLVGLAFLPRFSSGSAEEPRSRP